MLKIYRRRSGSRPPTVLRKGLTLCTAFPEGLILDQELPTDLHSVLEVNDTFVAASENGFVVQGTDLESVKSGRTWKSTLPGGSATLGW